METIVHHEGNDRVRSRDLSASQGDSYPFGFIAFVIAALLIWCSVTLQPSEWWLPYACLALLVGVSWMIPPVLTIDVDGIALRRWFG
jgi:hypothetical protein